MNMHVRTRASLLPLLLAAGWSMAGCDVTVNGLGGDRYTEREEKRFEVSGTPDIRLVTFDGSIEIRASDVGSVTVEIEKRAADKQDTDRIQVTANQSGNRITLEVKDLNEGHMRWGPGRSARLIARVPREANVEARSGDGSVTVDGLAGRLQVHTGDGSVRLTAVTGEVNVHTGDGSLSLDRVDGRVDAETGDGSISMNGKVEALRLSTGDGSVHVRAENGSRMADDWEVRTGDGSVGLELPEPFDANLDAQTNDGRVSMNSFTVKGDVERSSVRGQLGAGGKLLRIRTGDGVISISRS